MKSMFRVSVSVLALLAAGAVAAQPPGSVKRPLEFGSVDANKDGKLSPEEVRYIDDLNAAFGQLDVNRDAFLTPMEYGKFPRAAGVREAQPLSPATGPSGSGGAQHMPGPTR